ncbi:MAG: methylmalonyl Co-A mutase-associated GTPase MeaB [Bacteroidia bacterium]|nr:methylmalonyl Co-A mutase-associated GTPase MeaB [Bacteroidia bacterium]
MDLSTLLQGIQSGDRRLIARAITIVENGLPDSHALLSGLSIRREVPVTGITGPPGAGKSTLINALIREICSRTNAKGLPNQVGILAVDPSSPFTHGSLLGDRLRMQEHFNNPQVFIRSLATRGALGGLSAKTVEICDVLRSAPFDYIFIETVGVGQSEVEIISLADTVAVTLVPEAGDEIQALKSGIMEIGDIFVVNKSDREGADRFAAGLIRTLHERPAAGTWNIPVIKTIASRNEGSAELLEAIDAHARHPSPGKKLSLMAERAYRLIQHQRMKDLKVEQLEHALREEYDKPGFNLYRFVTRF